jgi:PTH1 family peptidyl-tRNA hydrolase
MVEGKRQSFLPGKGGYFFCETIRANQPVILVKPTTYMNRSGIAVKQALQYFDIKPAKMLVVCDDFHIDFGVLRFRKKGSDGGHNGLRSIIYHLESQLFNRLRFGIGHPGNDSVDFVLSDFDKNEQDELGFLFEKSREGIDDWIEYGIEEAMNKYNRNFLN